MTTDPAVEHRPSRSPFAISLGIILLLPATLAALAASSLAEAASNEFLYTGPGMIWAVVACAVIAAGLFIRALALLARPRPLRERRLMLAVTIAAGVLGPIAAWGCTSGTAC